MIGQLLITICGLLIITAPIVTSSLDKAIIILILYALAIGMFMFNDYVKKEISGRNGRYYKG